MICQQRPTSATNPGHGFARLWHTVHVLEGRPVMPAANPTGPRSQGWAGHLTPRNRVARCGPALKWTSTRGSRRAADTRVVFAWSAQPCHTVSKVNDAFVQWLMAPEDGEAPQLDLETILRRPEWHQRAACRGVGHELFFPERGQSVKPAQRYCDWCRVRDECLAWALESAEDGTPAERVGIWSGTSERQRRVLRRGAA